MLNLSLSETDAKSRGNKGYKGMSEERFLSSLNDARKEKIKKDSNELRDGFFKSKIDFLSQK